MKEDFLQQLRENPFAFDFFQAVRELERQFPENPRIGWSQSPREDPVRFTQHASLAFPPSTLHGLSGDWPPKLEVNFFGLLGANGPLPIHLTEYARDRARNARDTTLSSFLDVFHHRMISLFYRAWAANQKAADYDRPDESRFFDYLGSFLGLGDESVQGRDEIPDNAKVYYSGRLGSQSRNGAGLLAIIEDYFGVPATLESFVGHWLDIPQHSQCRLGGPRDCASLGMSAIAGSRVWDVQTRFRIRLGPLGYGRFQDFLPTERSFRRVRDWVRFYTGEQLAWDLQVVLLAKEVPATQLGGGARLGWTSWLQSQPRDADSEDLVIDPAELTNAFPNSNS